MYIISGVMKKKEKDMPKKQTESTVIAASKKKLSKIGQFLASGEKILEIVDMKAVLK